MRKPFIILGLFIAFLITYFLQSNFFSWFTIAGIKPNLFIVLALFVSLFAGLKISIGYSLFMGAFLDLVLGKNLGTYAIMLTCVAVLGLYFNKNFSKESRLTITLMVIAATALFEIGFYCLNIAFLKINIEVLLFLKILLIEIIFNSILAIILYPVMQRLGYIIEDDDYKEQTVLTRYF